MVVLMDMEWIRIEGDFVSPTQLAALRVDDQWNVVGSFDSLIRPLNANFHLWGHIAFSGASRDQFMAAPTASKALAAFLDWLAPEDVLLWWSDESPACFNRLVRLLLQRESGVKNHIVHPAFIHHVKDGKRTRGGLYSVAGLRGIPLPQPRHASVNDVKVFQLLMKQVSFPLSCLEQQPPKKDFVPVSRCSLPYMIDPETNTVHVRGCPALAGETQVRGISRLEKALKDKSRPCPACCREEWTAFLIQRNTDIIRRSNCPYFHLSSSRVFHRSECRMLLRTTNLPMGLTYYASCIRSGYSPCKLCKPTPNPSAPEAPQAPVIMRRGMNPSEKKAMKRFRQAVQERSALIVPDMTPQEREDAITLTITRFSFWAVPGYASFHLRSCAKLAGLSGLRGFSLYQEAVNAGFRPCRFCKPSKKHNTPVSVPFRNRERDGESITEIIKKCESHGFTCTCDEKMMVIITPVAQWRLDPWKRPITLMHRHMDHPERGGSQEHRQPRLFLSLMDVVQYIVKHDSP